MFAIPCQMRSGISGTLVLLKQVYFGHVGGMRKFSGWNAVLGLIGSMMQTVIFIMTFYFMFQLMGARSSPFKGNYMLYIISGIAMFMVHNTTVQAVAGAEGPTSGMMQHAPMHTICGMLGSAARRFINKQLPPEKSAPFTILPSTHWRFSTQFAWPVCFLQLGYRCSHWHGFWALTPWHPHSSKFF